jgi:hypothetical protein
MNFVLFSWNYIIPLFFVCFMIYQNPKNLEWKVICNHAIHLAKIKLGIKDPFKIVARREFCLYEIEMENWMETSWRNYLNWFRGILIPLLLSWILKGNASKYLKKLTINQTNFFMIIVGQFSRNLENFGINQSLMWLFIKVIKFSNKMRCG